jgi:sec-independent protein translocase protein TatA
MQSTVFFIGAPGGVEVLAVLLLAVLLFGADKIPKLARAAGQSLGEFRKGKEQLDEEVQNSVEEGGDEL